MALSKTTQRLAEIMDIQTTNDRQTINSIFWRLEYLGYTEICSRCFGSGHYSFNMTDGTKCLKCNGFKTVIPSKITKTLEQQIVADIDAGKLEPYFERLQILKKVRLAKSSVMDAWINSGISRLVDWHKYDDPENERLKEINTMIADEYKRIETLNNIYDKSVGFTHDLTPEKEWMVVILVTESEKAVENINKLAKMI